MYNIIICPSTFPNKYFPLESIFIKRHLKIISENNKVIVAFAKEGDDKKSYMEVKEEDNIIIITYYFKKAKKSRIENYINLYRFLIGHLIAVKFALKLIDKVDFFHVHILTRAAIIPFVHNLIYGTTFFITEHSSSHFKGKLRLIDKFKIIVQKLIVKKSRAISAVSYTLKDAMIKRGLHNKNFSVIPNVIDNDFFIPNFKYKKGKRIKFLHVSRLDQESKNIIGLLNAFSKLKMYSDEIELHIVGGIDEDINKLKAYIKSLNLRFHIEFYGNINKKKLRDFYQNSDYLVTFSNYETQGIVNIEALMCGLPIIGTKIPALEEYLHKGNSLLVKPKDEVSYSLCLDKCIQGNHILWSREEISLDIKKKFNKSHVRDSFVEFYNSGI